MTEQTGPEPRKTRTTRNQNLKVRSLSGIDQPEERVQKSMMRSPFSSFSCVLPSCPPTKTNMLVSTNGMPSPAMGCAATFPERSLGKRPQCYLSKPSFSCTVSLCCESGESRRGAGLLRPFEGRDQPSPRLRHGRQDRTPTFGCGGAALGHSWDLR